MPNKCRALLSCPPAPSLRGFLLRTFSHFSSWNVKSWKMVVTYYIYPLPISLMPCGWNWASTELDGGVIFFLGQLILLHFGFPRKMVFGWTFDFFTFKEKNQPHGLRPEDRSFLYSLGSTICPRVLSVHSF